MICFNCSYPNKKKIIECVICGTNLLQIVEDLIKIIEHDPPTFEKMKEILKKYKTDQHLND